MKLPFGRASIDNLDKYLAQKDYDKALAAVASELKRNPSKFNLLLRQAEILGMAGNRDQAISVYSSLAEKYARDGFYAKAIALYKKVIKLDSKRDDVHAELARLIEEDSKSRAPLEERLAASAKAPVPEAVEEAAREEAPLEVDQPEEEFSPAGAEAEVEEIAFEPEKAAAEEIAFEPEKAVAEAPAVDEAPSFELDDGSDEDADVEEEDAEERRVQEEKEREASKLFSSFEEGVLEEILSSTTLRSYDEGDIIVTEGEQGSSLFLIVSGEVKVFTKGERGEHLPLAELGPGDFFGEVSLLTGKPRTATITAKSPVAAIELGRAAVDDIATRFPSVHGVLESFYTRRAQETVEAVIRRMRGEE
jgi:cAMP-dependent protein kinase regulator